MTTRRQIEKKIDRAIAIASEREPGRELVAIVSLDDDSDDEIDVILTVGIMGGEWYLERARVTLGRVEDSQDDDCSEIIDAAQIICAAKKTACRVQA